MAKVRVLVADEPGLFREGICALLKICPDIEIVGQATSGEEAIEMARQQTPDVILTNMTMSIMNVTEVIKQIRRENSYFKVLLLSQHVDRQHILGGLKAGSNGCIPKSATASELISAILTLHEGDYFLYPSVAKMLMHEYLLMKQTTSRDPLDRLTAREKEVLQLLAEGLKCREVAARLHIAVRTVQGYRANIMRKCDIHTRTGLIKYAIRKQLVSIET